ncbi:conjugal transfer protein TraV [Pantoea cypripedii]|uniref:conjugal transfer protein TraV n=1 Tax=Pantoea cypripedii TaxID=55209 RepID=UPI001301E42D|nr:conjugal transfer protein TraV [Pantoea cypripedii]
MICTIHLTPRCRRPARGQVSLSRLLLDVDGHHYALSSRHFRTDASVGSRAVYASDRRASPEACGVLLGLEEYPARLTTTAIWRVDEPGEPAREARHVVQWMLPDSAQALLSDDTWLWPASEDTPPLSAGDWPVMDITPPLYPQIQRRGLTVIDTRNHRGRISRRYQTFPLAGLPPGTLSVRLPGIITPLTL